MAPVKRKHNDLESREASASRSSKLSPRKRTRGSPMQLTAAEFRDNYKTLFEADPTLSTEEVYELLGLNNFDIDRAGKEIRRRRGKPSTRTYYVPASARRNRSPSPAINNPPTTRTWKGSGDNSEDESEEVECVVQKQTKILPFRPQQQLSQPSQSFFRETNKEENDAEDEDIETPVEPVGIDNESGFGSYVDSDRESLKPSSGTARNNNAIRKLGKRNPTFKGGNPNTRVLRHREATQLTPWTFRLAKPFYNDKVDEIPFTPLDLIRNLPEMFNEALLSRILDEAEYIGDDAPREESLHSTPIWLDGNGRTGFSAGSIDGIKYRCGDFVLMPISVKSHRMTRSLSSEANEPSDGIQIARIEYFFHDNDSNEAMIHLRRFEFGDNTILQEFACTNEIYSLTMCQDMPLRSVNAKIMVQTIGAGDVKSVGLGEASQPKDTLFYRFHCNKKTQQFTASALHEDSEIVNKFHCYCCKAKNDEANKDQVEVSDKLPIQDMTRHIRGISYKRFSYRGINYHVHDFVYIFEGEKDYYTIGQIAAIKCTKSKREPSAKFVVKAESLTLIVSLYERHDTCHLPWADEIASEATSYTIRDERRLFLTGRQETIDVRNLDGKCIVKHRSDIGDLDAFKSMKDHFWFLEGVPRRMKLTGPDLMSHLRPIKEGAPRYSTDTEAENAVKEKRLKDYLKRAPKLRGMEIFSGCGGLSFGLSESLLGSVEWISAVEFSEAACRTFSANHPNCKVSCGDASELLQRAIQREQGVVLIPLIGCRGDIIQDLPRPGKIDFICGGPPCPGFSSLNRQRKPDDIKNSLVILYLSYLDFYKPKYFLMENVEQILTAPLVLNQESEPTTLLRGTLKFILRFASSFGYQSQFAILQSAEHGVPQSRKRAFIWGAQVGCTLPDYPQPDNVMNAEGDVKITTNRSNGWQRIRRAAPHYIVTVGDAIIDLPWFEWVKPYGYTPTEEEERLRQRGVIEQYEVKEDMPYVGKPLQKYRSGPLTEYQRKMRKDVRPQELTNHVTDRIATRAVWKTCMVPMRPGADQRDIVGVYPDEKPGKKEPKEKKDRFGRLNLAKPFRASHTKLDPSLRSGIFLHPFLHRVITIRENSRAMGFPDRFVFDLEDVQTSTIKDVARQQGNAVPPPLAQAIGESFLLALVNDYHRKKEMGMVEERRAAFVDEDGYIDVDQF